MRNIMKLFGSLVIFFYLYIVIATVIVNLNISFGAEKYSLVLMVNFVNDLLCAIIMLIIFRKLIKKGISNLKEKMNTKGILIFIWDLWVAFASIMVYKYLAAIVSSLLSEWLAVPSETVNNQTMVESLLDSAPPMMILATCIFAPIVEELIFRGAIGEAIKNKKVFITVSGLIFGFMHVTQNPILLFGIILVGLLIDYMMNNEAKFKRFCVTEKTLYVGIIILFIILLYGNNSMILLNIDRNEIIGSIVYISLGWYLAYLYTHKGNIMYPIIVHALNNILGVLLVLL